MTPDPDAERAAIALFERALDVPEGQVDAWLTRETADRPAVRDRLAALLAAHRTGSLPTGGAVGMASADDDPPERIGAYRLVERIGRGGMGSVYRGERQTGDFAHAVAIKLIKPGVLSQALIERFRTERRTLAGLLHPNIAQLYDGGETDDGAPYIVMELVDGEPLLAWLAAHDLPPTGGRRLFAQVCAAVAFAHRSLVVHRDITPSNVLVTAEGQVKLIDFGIAKPVEVGDDDASPSRGSIASLSLTPGYAAPERMAGAKVTTAADIFSLGRLLEKICPFAPGDIELRAIVAKATRTAPQDRYPTVDALAADVAALDAGFPVRAVGGGRRYLATKFLARHRRGVAVAAIVLLCLVGALAMTTLAYSRANAAREAESRRFAQLRSLANYLLFDLNDRMARVAGNTEARAALAARAGRYLSNLAASPHADAQVRFEAATGLIKLARIQGVPSEPNLGETERARASLATAERLLSELPAATEGVRPALAEAQALTSVVLLHAEGKPGEAAASLDRARASLGAKPPSAAGERWFQARRTVRRAELEQADLADRAADMARLADALEADIAIWPAAMRHTRAEAFDRALAISYRALSRYVAGDAKGSVPLFVDAKARFNRLERALPNDPLPLYMSAYDGSLGFNAASQIGREDVSAALIASAQRAIDQLLRLESRDAALYALAANIKEARAQNLRDHDRFGEAIALQRAVVADRRASIARRRSPRAEGNLAFSTAILGVIAKDAGDRALACESYGAAERAFSALDRRGSLIGFFAGFLPGLRANVAKCGAGLPVTSFGPLRS